MADTLIRGTIVTTQDVLKDGWIAVTGERIEAVGQGNPPPAATVLDYGANLVLQMREAEKNKGKRKGRVDDDQSHQLYPSGRENGKPSFKKKRH